MNRRFIIAAAALATGMAFIDTTALTVALPALQADLAASTNQLLWIHNAYAVPLAALFLLGGSLGDRYGTRRIFTYGVILPAQQALPTPDCSSCQPSFCLPRFHHSQENSVIGLVLAGHCCSARCFALLVSP
jgi:MFS family permease